MDIHRQADPNPTLLPDEDIIELYHQRDEAAIAESQRKYGPYCHSVAQRILGDPQDAEEGVNDTWVEAWGAMPPTRPQRLCGFLAAITRHLSLDRLDYNRARKRSGVVEVSEEFWECVPSDEASIEDEAAATDRINRFLGSLDARTRVIFLQRYFYMCPVKDIAARAEMSESAVKTLLFRTRGKLKDFLEKEGISV